MGGSGGGGGGPFSGRSPEALAKRVRDVVEEGAVKAFDSELNELLGEKLTAANKRDVAKVAERLEELKADLGDELESSIDILFGGSVAKHTYVDGLSDIDSLLVLDETFVGAMPPSDLINVMADQIAAANESLGVSAGKLAVTVEYPDGMQIQLLPSTRVDGQLRVPSFLKDGWSGIAPEKFQKALTDRNEECGGKLVPTIKLAKAVIGALPEPQRLSGYHVESIAISAFKGYDGPKTTAAMLPVFFEKARDLVMNPIRDSTGQSVHVDTYLGEANSADRVATGHVLGRIAKRMRNASAHQSADQWEALFGDDN
ncbi:MAG: nucleotidyltransferase [Devosia nanyangense]|uniref:Nucleotidyltransferase n=1 Tax=Devosia nanyangense TaxID=1228055 RepID=A0A933L2V5_9HYPH|nr:nucleotidyltransferase [Devosia nanyangense]